MSAEPWFNETLATMPPLNKLKCWGRLELSSCRPDSPLNQGEQALDCSRTRWHRGPLIDARHRRGNAQILVLAQPS